MNLWLKAVLHRQAIRSDEWRPQVPLFVSLPFGAFCRQIPLLRQIDDFDRMRVAVFPDETDALVVDADAVLDRSSGLEGFEAIRRGDHERRSGIYGRPDRTSDLQMHPNSMASHG